MKIGTMKHKITIERKVPAVTENGFNQNQAETVGTYWAEAKMVSSRESEKNKATQEEVRIKFRTRIIPGIVPLMEILFQGERYQIISIDALTYENRYLEIIGEKVTLSG